MYFVERQDERVVDEGGGDEAGVFQLDISRAPWTVTAEEVAPGVGSGFDDELRRLFPPDLAEEILSVSEHRAWPSADGLRERAEVFFARE